MVVSKNPTVIPPLRVIDAIMTFRDAVNYRIILISLFENIMIHVSKSSYSD